jgi:molybdopterin-guanine dinucleotide biosynthesis protein
MKIVTVSGTCSEVGKTGLVCELLARLPEWAAVKVTRGHYRSCGRDPDTCCVSGLLGDEPRVFGERNDTAVDGKDTARYWTAGAADVRWVVVARGQEAAGISQALAELRGRPGVVVEGNRVVEGMEPDLALMVARPGQREVKVSARRIADRVDALYVPDGEGARLTVDPGALVGAPGTWRRPVWGPADLDRIAAELRAGV